MYRYKVYDSKTGWIESAEDIRKLAKDVNKAIQILEDHWKYYSYSIDPVQAFGGVHERETGYEAFSGGSYPVIDWKTRRSWVTALIRDFQKEEAALDGSWFNTLSFDTIRVIFSSPKGPIVLDFHRGEMAVTICFDELYKDKEREILSKFEEAFGSSGA